ncbi:hypothetical protein Pcinc_042065 [Petrolisthes cinctipes]|uniref:Uncharacterized protein n=1 Tax=Petrolisthes cinctipes TaxID=88211 RepID=A0AAE1BI78_PETCI|nr:hypothetical protein Pcinc_042065 [Petrolisthes cinctipes]
MRCCLLYSLTHTPYLPHSSSTPSPSTPLLYSHTHTPHLPHPHTRTRTSPPPLSFPCPAPDSNLSEETPTVNNNRSYPSSLGAGGRLWVFLVWVQLVRDCLGVGGVGVAGVEGGWSVGAVVRKSEWSGNSRCGSVELCARAW